MQEEDTSERPNPTIESASSLSWWRPWQRAQGGGRQGRGRGGDDVGVRHLAFWSASLASEVAAPKVGPNSVARCQRSGRTGFRWSAFNMRDYFIPLLLSDWEGNIGWYLMWFHWLRSEEGGDILVVFTLLGWFGLVGWSSYYLGESRFKVICVTNHWSSPITKQQNKGPTVKLSSCFEWYVRYDVSNTTVVWGLCHPDPIGCTRAYRLMFQPDNAPSAHHFVVDNWSICSMGTLIVSVSTHSLVYVTRFRFRSREWTRLCLN